MTSNEFRITRSRSTIKPRVTAEDIPFYQEDKSKNVLINLGGETKTFFSGPNRSPVAELPYAHLEEEPGAALLRKDLLSLNDLPEGIELGYHIDGGFNNNCIVVNWSIADSEMHKVEWVCLKTFTGFQVKYTTPKKRSPLIFALADEDAFVYCDKKPCEECAFRCKNGFYAYVYISNLGIVKMPIDRVTMISFGKFDE